MWAAQLFYESDEDDELSDQEIEKEQEKLCERLQISAAEKVPNRLTTSTGLASDNYAGKKCVPYSASPYESLQISLNALIVITWWPPGHN